MAETASRVDGFATRPVIAREAVAAS